jgi:hypothetical protein
MLGAGQKAGSNRGDLQRRVALCYSVVRNDVDLINVSSDLRESEQVILSAHTRCRHTTYELALLSIIL